MTLLRLGLAAAVTLPALPAAALAAEVSAMPDLASAATTAATLFLIAVLLESALALLFNWRPFIETFNARATRPLVAFLVAWLLVAAFDYDAVTQLMDAAQKTAPPRNAGTIGMILTAAILAGGSAGVNTLLVALGFREVKTPATVAPRVPPDRAWIAVHVDRTSEQGDLAVHIGPPDAANANAVPLAGVIGPASKPRSSALGRFFLRQTGRFPAFGGFVAEAGKPCQVELRSPTVPGGTKLLYKLSFTPAPGAIIDLNVTV